MKNLTTPKAILFGLGLIALAIASVPYSSQIVKSAFASSGIQKVVICDRSLLLLEFGLANSFHSGTLFTLG